MATATDWLSDFKQPNVGSRSAAGGQQQNPNARGQQQNPNANSLPEGWEQGFDSKSGRIYYFNRQTQQSSWDISSAMSQAASQGQTANQGQAARPNQGQQPQQQQQQRDVPIQRGNMGMQRGGQADSAMQRGGQAEFSQPRQQQPRQQDVQASRDNWTPALGASSIGRGGGRNANPRDAPQEEEQGHTGRDDPFKWQGHSGGSSSDQNVRGRGGGKDHGGRGAVAESGGGDDRDQERQDRSHWSNFRGVGGGKDGEGGKGGKGGGGDWRASAGKEGKGGGQAWDDGRGKSAGKAGRGGGEDEAWGDARGKGGKAGRGGGEDGEAWEDGRGKGGGKAGRGGGEDGGARDNWRGGKDRESGKDRPSEPWKPEVKYPSAQGKARPRDADEEYEGRQQHRQEESTGLITLARQGYDDDSLPNDRNFIRKCSNAEELNFAENYITGVGLTWMLKPCSAFAHLRVMKLHKNHIGDSAANCLVRVCRNSPVLDEIHLSHNQLTWAGADKIVPAACERQIMKNIEGGQPTLWLRLEMNHVEDARSLFNDWQRRGLDVVSYHKSDQHTPKGVILPYFMSQRVAGSERVGPAWEFAQESWGKGAWGGPRAAMAEWWGAEAAAWGGAKGWKGAAYAEAWAWEAPAWGKGKGKGAQALGDWAPGAWGGAKGGKGAQGGKDWHEPETKGKGKSAEKGEGKKGDGKKGDGKKGDGKSAENVDDSKLEVFCKERAANEDYTNAKVLDLANCHLSGVGFSHFADLCFSLACLAVVKLHKNALTDAAAPSLAGMCRKCPLLRELHLSHNLITKTGAEELVVAACEGRHKKSTDEEEEKEEKSADEEEEKEEKDEKEDKEEKGGLQPLWLRLEYNEIAEPQALFDDWKERELNVVMYGKGPSRQSPSRHNLPKGVHLPFFLNQGKPSGYAHGESEKKEEEEEVEEKKEPAGKGKKDKTQLKWKPKVQAAETAEEEKEEGKEATPKGDEQAEASAADKKEEEKGEEVKEKKTSKRSKRERGAADDGDVKEVFSSAEESEGSEA